MTKTKGSIEDRLIRSMEQAVQIAKGKATPAQTYNLPLTVKEATVPEAPAYNSEQVIEIRNRLRLSQALFARALNVSTGTVRSWEQGEKPPQGPSRRLLEIAARSPETILSNVIVTRPDAPRNVSSNRVHALRSGTDRRSGSDRRGTVQRGAKRR